MRRFQPDRIQMPCGHFMQQSFQQSGIGKDLGRQAVEANLRHKSVLIDFGAA
jgi:hypothetical protein